MKDLSNAARFPTVDVSLPSHLNTPHTPFIIILYILRQEGTFRVIKFVLKDTLCTRNRRTIPNYACHNI